MRPWTLATPLALVLVTSGCVSRAEYDQAKQQLETCERDKVAAQKSTSDCETRLTTETKRWDAIESQLTSTLPQTLKEFQDERTKIIEIVPQQVRNEVARRLDRYFVNVSKQFDAMQAKVETLREELRDSRADIAKVAATASTVDQKVTATQQAVLSEQARAGEMGRRVTELIASISEFDRERVNCEKCKDRIKLKGKSREDLLAFHSELIQSIQALQTEGLPR